MYFLICASFKNITLIRNFYNGDQMGNVHTILKNSHNHTCLAKCRCFRFVFYYYTGNLQVVGVLMLIVSLVVTYMLG